MVDYKKELNEQQYEAVVNTEGPVLVLAGAGSGKTTTIKYRTAYLLEQGVDPASILILTFTNRAANEIKSRVIDMLGEKGAYVKACTYHGFCAEVLRAHGNLIGLGNDFTIMSAGDTEDALTLICGEFKETEERDFPTVKQLFQIFSKSRNTETPIDDLEMDKDTTYEYINIIKNIKDEYENYKKEHDLVDYTDLIYDTNLLFGLNPSIRQEYVEKYKYKMVDEYQDTNNIQLSLIKNLCKGNNNIAVVGDPAQCIMGFQGANVNNILHFPDYFEGCKVIKLEKNYRSTQEILNMANATLEMMPSELNLTLKSNGKTGKKPVVAAAMNTATEAKIITESILKSYQLNPKSIKDIAVLVRRSMDSFLLESNLMKAGIPYKKYGGLKLMDKVYMKDILAFLKVTVNPKDELSWFRLLMLCEGVGSVTARKIIQGIMKDGTDYLLDIDHDKKKYEMDLRELYDIYSTLKMKDLKAQIEYLIAVYFPIQEKIITNRKTSADKWKKALNDNEKNQEEAEILFDFIKEYTDAKSFLTDITLETPETDDDFNLTISTIHSAKGKEYGKVFLMNCVDYDMDHKNRKVEDESRRCFYVAITRAKYELCITYPVMGARRTMEPSQFLIESGDVINSYDKLK